MRDNWTPEERELYDARAEEEAWRLARKILGPWVESSRPIGSDELTGVMEGALGQVDENLDRARRKLARLEGGESMTEETGGRKAVEREGMIGFSDEPLGPCTVGSCDRPATNRVWENFKLCAHHRLRHELAQDEDAASLSLELLAGWRSQAETHDGLEALVSGLNEIMGREDERYSLARERVRVLDRADEEERSHPERLRVAGPEG